MKSHILISLFLSMLVAFLLIISASIVDKKFGYILQHYYQRTVSANLTDLSEYSEQKGNFIKVTKRLNEEGIKIDYIKEGNTDKYDSNTAIEEYSYTKTIYFINDQFYIIFDWRNEDIINRIEKEQLRQQIHNQNTDLVEYAARYISLKETDGKIINYKIIPTEDNQFGFVE